MPPPDSYVSIFLTFLRFGFLAWGGPVAQIGMIREELVTQRQWITPEKFNRVLAIYQALPGPEAHELCVYFGMIRRGRTGAFLAGLGFMLPGLCLMLLLSWAYTQYGALALLPLFVGIAPAVTALILRALHRIGSHSLTDASLWIAAVVSVGLTLLQVHFLLVFAICAIWRALWAKGQRRAAQIFLCAGICASLAITLAFAPEVNTPTPHGGLLTEGLKAGLLSFGGAYTALPFLKSSMVGTYPAITPQAFLDGIALTNIIPAPLVIFGTYLGYLADGLTGAILITLGIFIPAFSFTMLGHKYLEKIVENPALHGFLDGIAAAVVGLLAITACDIALHTLTGAYQFLLFGLALAGFYWLKKKWAVPVVIIVCGALGLILPI